MTNKNTFQSIDEAYGELPFSMMNDCMFRILLQDSNKTLCGLVRALLHIPPDVAVKAEITNPIKFGESVIGKEMRMDINLILNGTSHVNLEMQVVDRFNWQDRSLAYLCRSYDQLERGDEYSDVQPVIHIGFLDYTLFKDCPEFYATYKMMNVKNQNIYNDKFVLGVVDLSQIELATDEDKAYHIDYWARLFKSKTWEELRMLAEQDEYISEATKTVFKVTTDAQAQKLIHDRQEYNNDMKYYRKQMKRLDDANREIAEINKELAVASKELSDKNKELSDKNKELSDKNKELSNKNKELFDKNKELSDKDKELSDKDKELSDRNGELCESRQLIEKQNAEIAKLRALLEAANSQSK